ncbi:MAG: DUF4331 domain-containing protein [Candidatus Sulfotelmatobacter sp.]|jgi:hypothetical protein
MKNLKSLVALALSLFMLAPSSLLASSHREAPITALDRTADVTDWYAFVSYDNPNNVTMILNVDPLLEPANGPNYFPFDPNVVYQMLVDNNQDGIPDVIFQFRFNTQIRDPRLFTGFVGNLAGVPPITSLSGAGSEGLSLRQTYTVTMIKNGKSTVLNGGRTLYAVPSNVGPKTMPEYQSLFNQGIDSLGNGITVWAGTADDPFFIDLGAFFDSVNFRSGVGPVLSPTIDADETHNYAPDAVGGYNVNSIVLEVPIALLTVDGKTHPASAKQAVIGTYGSTARHQITVRQSPNPDENLGSLQQVNREGNSLINEAIIGTGFKDRFSMDFPINDSQFTNFVLEPVAAGVLSSLGVPVPPNPRKDLLLLVQYQPPICPGCGPNDAGPVADLLRLNTGIPPTPVASQKRLGFIAGDVAGYPNGRRPIDDVFDISLRAIEGILVDSSKYGLALGDGVNTKTEGFNNSFPYVMPANSGRNSAHTGPGQAGCTGQPGGICPVE